MGVFVVCVDNIVIDSHAMVSHSLVVGCLGDRSAVFQARGRSLFPVNLLNDGMQPLVKYGASQA